MATSKNTIDFLCEQIASTGVVEFKKIFGEYMIYLNGKPIFIVCDETLFVKNLPELTEILKGSELGSPYNGAKPHLIVDDVDNKELLCELALTLEKIIPLPKPKKKKGV